MVSLLGKVTRCSLLFQEASLEVDCKNMKENARPGVHTCWMVISPDRENGELVSRFASSFLRLRRTTRSPLESLPSTVWTNPSADLLSPGGARNLSESQKSKQWITGLSLWTEVCQAMPKHM